MQAAESDALVAASAADSWTTAALAVVLLAVVYIVLFVFAVTPVVVVAAGIVVAVAFDVECGVSAAVAVLLESSYVPASLTFSAESAGSVACCTAAESVAVVSESRCLCSVCPSDSLLV